MAVYEGSYHIGATSCSKIAAQSLRVRLSEQPLKIHTKQPKIKGGLIYLKRGENGRKRPAVRSKHQDEEKHRGEALREGDALLPQGGSRAAARGTAKGGGGAASGRL